jgi:hypothetical protein
MKMIERADANLKITIRGSYGRISDTGDHSYISDNLNLQMAAKNIFVLEIRPKSAPNPFQLFDGSPASRNAVRKAEDWSVVYQIYEGPPV